MKQRNKMAKKILSLVLAASLVLTSGITWSSTAKAEDASSVRGKFKIAGADWTLYGNYLVYDETNKITYCLNSDGTAWVTMGDNDITSGTVRASIPFSYIEYEKYLNAMNVSTPSPEDYFNDSNKSTVTTVINAAFKECRALESLTIESGVSKIGKDVFVGCAALTKLYVPDSVDSMGYDTDSSNAVEADILDSTSNGCTIYCTEGSYADTYAQSKNYILSYVTQTDTTKTVAIDGKDWNIYSDYTVVDTQGVKYQLNENDTTVKVTAYDKTLASSEDNTCTIPKSIPLKYSVCKKILAGEQWERESTDISNVTEIEKSVFCLSSLEKIIIEADGVQKIGEEAFSDSSSLTVVQIPNTVSIIGDRIIEGSPNCTIYCWKNTTADSYAVNAGYKVKYMDDEESPSPSTAPTDPAESTKPTESPDVQVTPVPSATVSPAASQGPTNPWLPDGVATSVPATQRPVVTQTPSATVAPESTVSPSATVVPDSTNTANPSATTAPDNTGAPAVTTAPDNTDSPSVSAAPTETPAQQNVVIQENGTVIKCTINQSKGKATVTSMEPTKAGKITVPATVSVNGVKYPVTVIGKNAFAGNKKVKAVSLGKNVATIKSGAFKGCTNLTKVTFSSKISTLEKNSFNGCKKLKTVSLPSSVKKIGVAAFKNCKGLKKLRIGKKIKKGALSADGRKIRYGAGSVKLDISASAFENCVNLKQMVINSLVRRIGNSALKNCKSLRDLIVNSKVLKEVAKKALKGVSNCKISVPSVKLKPYSVLFKNKGQGKKVIVAKM